MIGPDERLVVVVRNTKTGDFRIPEEELCVATWASHPVPGEACGREGWKQIGDAWFCAHHYRRAEYWVAEEVRNLLREVDDHPRTLAGVQLAIGTRVEREVAAHLAAAAAAKRKLSVIYYVRRADGLIKIGTSSRLSHRMSSLRKEHGRLEILLTHPGARDEERDMHRKFDELRVTGEWFRNTKRLALWIQKCRRDPAIGAGQVASVVDMEAIRLLLREGIRASLAESVRHESPEEMFARLIRDGKWPPKSDAA